MTILYSDPLFERHETGQHPERYGRLGAVLKRLERGPLLGRCMKGAYEPLSRDQVLAVHGPEMEQKTRLLAESGGGWLDADTCVSAESYRVALAAAGACVAAGEQVMRGIDSTALCLVRPPGHHATAQQSMGFCLFNNIALAAHHARTAFALDRILIVDWDVHHGNGTQDIFWRDPGVFFLSLHRYGHGFYPGTGAADETGSGRGLGFTANVPVRYGTRRADYRALYRNAVEAAADKIKPDLIFLSAGFDAHARDPIGSLDLEVEDFTEMTEVLLSVAKTHAHGRLVSCLEGGYNPDALAESVEAHLDKLLQADQPLPVPPEGSHPCQIT